ncbi:AraC family transcriptional regulator [Marvinbryantia formatexigens]|uniref:AraC family transcriptional regulator n=1 Tax=Marvinbryantia formatexigens TaxID=168384 RepID=UPI000592A349|nr:AraC family transcriptional regulator [Marvinbryantia formatexigens]
MGYTNSASYKCLENLKGSSTNLYLMYCGWEICDPGHRFGPNRRSSYVLHMVQEGRGYLEMGEAHYTLEKGDVFLIPEGVEAWYEADKETPWSYRWIGFEGVSARECLESAGFTPQKPVRKVRCLDKVGGYIDQMLKCHQLYYENELKRNALLMLVFAELITDNRKNLAGMGKYPSEHRYPSSVYVEHAIEYINENYSKRLRINELADYIGVNRSYLTSSFQENIGCSPREYLMKLRMEKAKTLLKNPDIQVNEVAAMVGYTDPLAFSKIFKSRTGRSPKEYKEEKSRLVVGKKKGDCTGNV